MVAKGLVGYTNGFTWTSNEPSNNDIDADNDGVMNPSHQFIVSLSDIAGSILGYQASMMASYKIHRVRVGIRPVDDVVDNDAQTQFAGDLCFHPCTEHGKKALQMARKVEKAKEATEVDADSLFLTTDNDYSGFRYGWSNVNSGGVAHKTANGVAGMGADWYLSEIFSAYNAATAPVQSNAIFGGRAPEESRLGWSCGFDAGLAGGLSAQTDFQVNTSVEILPIILGRVLYSSGDEEGLVDDDYHVEVEIEFTPEHRGTF